MTDGNMLQPGTIFGENWRIEGVLGSGGFATVYAAENIMTGRSVALKILRRPEGGYPADIEQRFRRELRVLGRLRSPYTVTMYTGGEADGAFYAVFERIDGKPLSEVLRERGRLSAREVRKILSQLLESLEEAHQHGVLHRDIKPENILILPNADAKLIDFGLARPLAASARTVTATGELVGTPRYMSPEQLTEQPLTPASDVYSLGLVAFEMLMGRSALHGNAWSDQLDRLHSGHVFSVSAFGQMQGLDKIIERMSTRDPRSRYQSAAAVLHALRSEHGSRADSVRSTEEAARPAWVVPIVLGVLAVGIAVAFWPQSRDDAPVPLRPPPAAATASSVASTPPPPDKPAQMPVGSEGCDAPRPQPHGYSTQDGYTLYVPKVDPTSPRPLVVFLHDRFDEAQEFMPQTRWGDLAEKEGAYVLAPHTIAVERSLGKGRFPDPWGRPRQLERVWETIRAVRTTHCIDLDRLYLVGNGFGGRGAEQLMCSRWAAVATYGSLGAEPFAHCKAPDKPPRMLKIVGRQDQFMNLFGGPNCAGFTEERTWNDLDRAWADHYPEAIVDDPRPFGPNEAQGRCRTWSSNGVPQYQSCVFDHGHRWPGFEPRPKSVEREKEICDGGPTPRDFPLEQMMWDFFAAPDDAAKVVPDWHSSGCLLNFQTPTPSNMHWPRKHDGPVPLVVLFRSIGVDHLHFLHKSGFEELADEKGFAVLSLPGKRYLQPHFNPWSRPTAKNPTKSDAVAAALGQLGVVLDNHCIDLRRVYAVGHGAGADAARYATCEADVFAATATVSSISGVDCSGRELPMIPRLRLNPTRSRHVPVFGQVSCQGHRLGPLNDHDTQLANVLDCTTTDPEFTEDNSHQRRAWTCDGRNVLVSELVPGSDSWPNVDRMEGGDPRGCDAPAPEFDYPERIWRFFEDHGGHR